MTGHAIAMGAADWLSLFGYFMGISLLCVGGAIATIPEQHRFLVQERAWLTDPQFSASIALAQAAPGPNILFTGLMGWNIGLNAGGLPAAFLGLVLCLGGVMLPSSVLVFLTVRWSHENRDRRAVRSFRQGLAPVVIGLMVSTGWVLGTATGYGLHNWPVWAVVAVSTLLVWRTRIHLLWLLGAGAVVGGLGWL